MPHIEIYTTPWCPYCIAAKRLLDKKGVAYEETDVAREPALRAEMTKRAQGRHTVPQIFFDGRYVADCDGLHALDRAGKLDALLGR